MVVCTSINTAVNTYSGNWVCGTHTTSGAGTVHPSGAPEFTSDV